MRNLWDDFCWKNCFRITDILSVKENLGQKGIIREAVKVGCWWDVAYKNGFWWDLIFVEGSCDSYLILFKWLSRVLGIWIGVMIHEQPCSFFSPVEEREREATLPIKIIEDTNVFSLFSEKAGWGISLWTLMQGLIWNFRFKG